MMEEPSVLDYVKARLMPWKGPAPAIPADPGENGPIETVVETPRRETKPETVIEPDSHTGLGARPNLSIIWRPVAAVFLGLLAQRALEPPDRSPQIAVLFYSVTALLLIWSYLRGDWPLAKDSPSARANQVVTQSSSVRFPWLGLAVLFAGIGYWAFGSYKFNTLNLLILTVSFLSAIMAFWEPSAGLGQWRQKMGAFIRQPNWTIVVSPGVLLLIAAAVVATFFRVYRLGEVPPEMISDHAEKLLDVGDVLRGEFHVFFPRNTGREALQMYLTAAMAQIFNTGLSFLSLKLGTVLLGLVTLPFVYLLGKEYGNSQVGLVAFLFAGIAYWPNVTSRIALRFTLYAAFVAPTLYFFVKGMRTTHRNDFILAGIFLGLGLHGYSPFRVVPLLLVLGLFLALVHKRGDIPWQPLIIGFSALVLISIIVFLPLGRYAVDNPEMVSYRMVSRLGSSERPLPGPAWQIFLKNFWNAATMFFWSNGETWVHSVTFRPALDVVSAAFYGLGVVLLLTRYFQKKDWRDLFLLISIPLLLLPSIMSLAFPGENPALNRTTGAWVPAFIVMAVAFEGLLAGVRRLLPGTRGVLVAGGMGVFLFVWSAQQNYDLVFNQYQRQYQLASWNTSEVGGVVRSFTETIGPPENAWVVGFPHWVDSRLVSINAGYPMMDNAIWPDQFETSLDFQGAKLFLIRPEHTEAIDQLQQLYPNGDLRRYHAEIENKDFYMFMVPP